MAITRPVADVTAQAEALARFIRAHPRLVVLTGAGISLDSGIPVYRDETGMWLPGPPIQERDFLQNPQTRRLYWARSWRGWPVIRDASPNACHDSLAALEALGNVRLLITQNVDGLHQKAGSRKVVDLHGRVDRVRCLDCNALHARDEVQTQLRASTGWPEPESTVIRPDGDAEIAADDVASFSLPRCSQCGGDLRPDVVFFGGSVPKDRVERCHQALDDADALLVVGSSLKVFSGFRFCRRASQLRKTVAIVNPGLTRADELADIRFRSAAGPLLSRAVPLLH